MRGQNGPWIAMPAQKQLDRDGQPRVDAAGKPLFNQIIEFATGPRAPGFNEMVIALVRAADPTFPNGGES